MNIAQSTLCTIRKVVVLNFIVIVVDWGVCVDIRGQLCEIMSLPLP